MKHEVMASPERQDHDGQKRLDNPEQPMSKLSGMIREPNAAAPIELTEITPSTVDPDSTHGGLATCPHNTNQRENGNLQSQESQRCRHMAAGPNMSPDAGPQQALPTFTPGKTDGPGNSAPPPPIREATRPAIGSDTDKPSPVPKEPEIEGPVLYITLLLTTGARHPFRLDQKYLRKRNVEVDGNNPVNMSLYKLKELILRDWREGTSF